MIRLSHHHGKFHRYCLVHHCLAVPVQGMAKFCNGIFSFFSFLLIFDETNLSPFSGRSLAAVRERVERQRSVPASSNINNISIDGSGSLDELNLDTPIEKKNIKNSVERLDTQVSSLHQDVATLSIEVNAGKRPSLKFF
jgi:hypothetical protein